MNKKSFFKIVLTMCLMALPLMSLADDYPRGDCNHDGFVNVSDATTLVNFLLTSSWPGEQSNYEIYTVNGVSIKMI